MQRERKKQPLRARRALLHALQKAFVQHALTRRVLINQHNAFFMLEHEVHATQLNERRDLHLVAVMSVAQRGFMIRARIGRDR